MEIVKATVDDLIPRLKSRQQQQSSWASAVELEKLMDLIKDKQLYWTGPHTHKHLNKVI